jgi:outer membrane murein-binding lipoprotein Lpp
MASDKLMNHTQGETIITKLTAIADSLDDLAAVTPAKLGMGIATCDTPGSTVAKTAALANFALVEGAPVSVQFLYANTAANATLNINNTGAKPIIYKDAAIGNDVISAGDTCTFIYTTNTYKITNIDTLTGPGSGTVRQVGAENGLITDQSDNADIQTTGKIGLNLKSDTAFSTEVGAHNTSTDNMYPVALDSEGHPVAAVSNFVGSGSNHKAGLVPDTPSTAGTTKYLREDATWVEPTGDDLKLTGYEMGSQVAAVAATDTINEGIGKLEYKVDANSADIQSILDGTTIDSFSDVETALSGKQATLSTAQLAAVNSGIDTTKVGQIATNTTDISSLQDAVDTKLDKTANAVSAAKLNNGTADYAVGSATKGVYFNNGVPTAMTYSVNSNVPENAVFTDTTYSSGTGITVNSSHQINHSNSVSEKTTASALKVAYDAQGHITGSSALTASDVGAVPNTSAGVSAAINQLTTGDSAPTDNDYYVSQYAGGGTSTTTYHRRPVSKLWEYIKSKLASKGSATQPVYFSNGVPVATTYTLGKSVPSDAKFTDTTYSVATIYDSGLMSNDDKFFVNSFSPTDDDWKQIAFNVGYMKGGYMMFGNLCLIQGYIDMSSAGSIYTRSGLPEPLHGGSIYVPIYQDDGTIVSAFKIKGFNNNRSTSSLSAGTYYITGIYMSAG